MLYAHYDREDRVSDLDLESLKAMRSDVDELVFISNSRLTEKEKKKVAGVSDRVWLRENKGYDFGAWKYGMERLGFDYLAEFGQVILMNNSSVGPIYGLKMVFDRMRREQKDFLGGLRCIPIVPTVLLLTNLTFRNTFNPILSYSTRM